MLRITRTLDHDDQPLLRLEGKLIGPWAGELARICEHALTETPGRPGLRLDLSAVSFVDADGLTTLSELRRRGIVVTSASLLVAELLHAENP